MQKPIDSLRILIVDDDDTQRLLTKILLTQLGVKNITEVRDGKEGLSALLDEDDDYDVVFTDKDMPQADGMDLILNIRECASLSSVKVAMITGKLTNLTSPREDEVVLRRFLKRTSVLPIPKDGLNKTILKEALETLIGL